MLVRSGARALNLSHSSLLLSNWATQAAVLFTQFRYVSFCATQDNIILDQRSQFYLGINFMIEIESITATTKSILDYAVHSISRLWVAPLLLSLASETVNIKTARKSGHVTSLRREVHPLCPEDFMRSFTSTRFFLAHHVRGSKQKRDYL